MAYSTCGYVCTVHGWQVKLSCPSCQPECLWTTVTNSPYATGPLSCLYCLSVCNVGVLWPNGSMDQYATL